MRRALVIVALVSSACIESNLVSCPDGRSCPDHTVCDDVHDGCVTGDQLAACVGVADQSPCTAGAIVGFCVDQVCLAPTCGDHAIEPGEACDDGNQLSGDGCSGDCSSREICGNGVIDAAAGEQCDDGNLLSHDGCDSRCLVEQITWAADGIDPTAGNPGWGAYDSLHHELLHYDNGLLWAWKLDHWELRSIDGPSGLKWYSTAFDPDRGTFVVAGVIQVSGMMVPVTTPILVWEWDGSTWAERNIPGAPALSYGNASTIAYDLARHALFVFGTAFSVPEAWTLAASWAPLPAVPAASGLGAIATYDVARGREVVVIGHAAANPDVLEWTGVSWTSAQPPLSVTSGFGVGYDPVLHEVVAVGGAGAATQVASWDGAMWAPLSPLPTGRTLPEVVGDPDRGRLVSFAGNGGSSGGTQEVLYEWNGGGWTIPPFAFPLGGTFAYAYDEARDRLVAYRTSQTAPETWIWNGSAWSQIDSTGLPTTVNALAYDPGRAGVVLTSNSPAKTWVLDDAQWTALIPGATTGNHGIVALAMTYDFSTGQLVALTTTTTQVLLETDNGWHDLMVPVTPSSQLPSLAYDARNARVVLTDAQGGETFELVMRDWVPTVSPGPVGYYGVADRRRGTVWFESQQFASWERVDANWVQRPPMVVPVFGPPVYATDRGEVVAIGVFSASRIMLRRQFTSATPNESCRPGDDLDGDGLAGCDDPDCWPICKPACPPYVSCP